MKSYTDIEQSKVLSEILPFESADMAYIKHSSSNNPNWEFNEDFPPMILGNVPINEMTVETLPCWSLVALLNVIPYNITFNRAVYLFKLVKFRDHWECYHEDFGSVSTNIFKADNPIDACYKMILKLHKLKSYNYDFIKRTT